MEFKSEFDKYLFFQQKGNKLLDLINYKNFAPKNYKKDPNIKIPYTDSGVICNPVFHYLCEVADYVSHGSGDDDFGILKKSIWGIPSNRFIKIEILGVDIFKITWIVEDVDEVLTSALSNIDYDLRMFDKLGFTKKFKIIKLNFDISEDIDEQPNNEIFQSGILDYNQIVDSLIDKETKCAHSYYSQAI